MLVRFGFNPVAFRNVMTVLRRYGFDFDEIVLRSPSRAERLRSLQRRMGWIVTGAHVR